MTGNEKRFVRIDDVAEILDVSPRQVEALIDRGELPAVRIGGRNVRRIAIAALEDYIQQLTDDAAERARGRGSR